MYSSYNNNNDHENGSDFIEPWWVNGNDSDLHRTAYADDLPADYDDDGMISTSSSMAVVETTKNRLQRSTGHHTSRHVNGERHSMDAVAEEDYHDTVEQTPSSSRYQAKSARRDTEKRRSSASTKSHVEDRKRDGRKDSPKVDPPRRSREERPTKGHSGRNSSPRQGQASPTQEHRSQPSSSSSPAREKIKGWTETGKKKLLHAVDKFKSAQVLTPKKGGATNTVRWSCAACTYLNVRDNTNAAMDDSTSHWTCEVCGTPRETKETVESRSSPKSRLPGATVYHDDIPCDPADVIERTLMDDIFRDGGQSAKKPDSVRKSSTSFSTLPFQSAFERLFYQKHQNSATTAETHTGGSSDDLDQARNQDGVDSRSDTASSSLGSGRVYSVAELVASLGAVDGDVELPPALERRVRDFKFAQNKRRERHGDQKPWGIYGLYAHLSDIRADLEWAEDAAWRRQRGQPYLSWRDFDKSRDKGLHNRPWFTYGLMALCTIMMFVTLGVNGWKFEPLNVNPLIGPSSETLIKCGARDTNLIVNEAQWYRLFTPMILHAGIVHYVVNMMALYFIGGAVEQSHGFASAAVLFIIPAVGGNILSAICLPQYISVGASGGIFGLIGGCIADICLNWNLLFLKTTTDANTRLRHFYVLLWLGIDIIVNCLLGFTPFVDNFTHLGGFMYGFCCGISTIERLAVGFFGINADKCSRLGSTFVRFFGLIISIIAIMVTTVVLVQSDGVTSPCHGCRYISCVPFPPNAKEKWWYCDDCDVVTADLFRSSEGSGLYEQVNLYCPNGEVEEISIAEDGIDDKEVLRRALPSYCRAHCEDVFSN